MANRETHENIPMAYAVPMPAPVATAPGEETVFTSICGDPSLFISHQEQTLISDASRQVLIDQGYTDGLAMAISRKVLAFPLTIWVVDNSGSMSISDGHRLICSEGSSKKSNNLIRIEPCSRWSEMQQTVDYHAQLAALLRSPTVFRLLNDPGRVVGPQQFSVGERKQGKSVEYRDNLGDHNLSVACSTIWNTSPGGVTPLTRHVREIREHVRLLEPQLRQQGTKVAIVLATDGIPTDEYGNSNEAVKNEFLQTIRSLEGLPVWIVVRLCTDENSVVDYWNQLDSHLELSLEVLDDFCSEAAEIYQHNKWLNYALPLHRTREMGFHNRVLDILDERSLSKGELRDFFHVLFGVSTMNSITDPEVEWTSFVNGLEALVAAEKLHFNPISKRLEPWVNIKQLKIAYGGGSRFSLWR